MEPTPKTETSKVIAVAPANNIIAAPSSSGLALNELGTADSDQPVWKPHENSWTELPIPLFKGLSAGFYEKRWMARYPFQKRILWNYWTLGELLLFILVLGIAGGAGFGLYHHTSGTGQLAGLSMIFIWLLAMHNSIWTFLLGLPFERAIWWHIFFVYVAVGLGAYHGAVGQIFDKKDKLADKSNPNHEVDSNTSTLISGYAFEGFIIALIVLSQSPVRRHLFEVFYRLHIVLSIGTMIVAVIHGAAIILAGAIPWIADVVYRYFFVARGKRNPREVEAVRLPANVVRLTFPKGAFHYTGGQYVFVNIPGVTMWAPIQHLFTPTDTVTLHVRVLGNWTKRLHSLVSKDGGGPKMLKAYIEGPYGSPMIDLDSAKYKNVLMISGGIGITPMQSICNDLHAQFEAGRPMNQLTFLWVARDRYLVDALFSQDSGYTAKALPKKLPLSFQPDLMPAKNDSILTTEYYLTKVTDETDKAAHNIRLDLQPYLRLGRPNLAKVFDDAATAAASKGETAVAVLVCGPASLVASVRKLSSSKIGGVRFDFHAEVFEL